MPESFSDFTQDVIDRSYATPVVVDFWAEWCGPCRYLGPVLEQLDKDAGDRWQLVKINADRHEDLMVKYNIRGIPAVKLFFKGEVIAEFSGALPERQILEWLDDNLPDPRKDRVLELSESLNQVVNETAMLELENLFQEHPDLMEARLKMAWFRVAVDPVGSRDLVEGIKAGNKWFDQAEDVRALADLQEVEEEGGQPKLAEALTLARQAAKDRDHATAIAELIKAVTIDKNYAQEMPRRACIAYFRFLGEQHELTRKFRPQFNMALY